MISLQEWRRGAAAFFGDGAWWRRSTVVREEHLRPAYRSWESFSDYLPWLDLVEDYVLLEDGRSLAAVLELQAVGVEGWGSAQLAELRANLQQVLGDALPAYERFPWVVQMYAWQDTPEKAQLLAPMEDYAERIQGEVSPYGREFLRVVFASHLEELGRSPGRFTDPRTKRPWGLRRRRVFLVLYRRLGRRRRGSGGSPPLEELARAEASLGERLQSAGVGTRRLPREEVCRWLFDWLNFPAPPAAGELAPLTCTPPQKGGDLPFGDSLADSLCCRDIRSDARTGRWYFNGMPRLFLGVERLRAAPIPGQLSAERVAGEKSVCLLEQLPPGAVLSISWVVIPAAAVERHLERLARATRSATLQAEAAHSFVQQMRLSLVEGEYIYPCSVSVLLRAAEDSQLSEYTAAVDTLLLNNALQIIHPSHDPAGLDGFLRQLPMAFDPALDQVRRRNRYMYTRHIAALLPLYGRGTGSGRPALVFFNRAGELFRFDPLQLAERSRNAHLFLFGPTGAGKSATLVYLLMLLMAVHRPRVVLIEAGNSFGLLSAYFESRGISTHDVVLRPGCGASLPPFTDAALLRDETQAARLERDILGELGIVARLMVTGGRPAEENNFSRADASLLQQAILRAAREGDAVAGPSTSDVVRALEGFVAEQPERAGRIRAMADAMRLFSSGFAGELFDRPGSSWPDADFTRLEMGILAGDGYSDQLAVAYIGLINAVIARAHRLQRDGRPTILLTDEAHVITTNPLISTYLVQIAKLLGRRLGLWFWMATQNMRDFAADAEKMLAMFEWWLCLHMGKSELAELQRFRRLSPAQQTMIEDTRKYPGTYTEGVLLSDRLHGLLRNVPPPLCLALAQSEKEEKTRRGKIMEERGCSELEAALVVAEELRAAAGQQEERTNA